MKNVSGKKERKEREEKEKRIFGEQFSLTST